MIREEMEENPILEELDESFEEPIPDEIQAELEAQDDACRAENDALKLLQDARRDALADEGEEAKPETADLEETAIGVTQDNSDEWQLSQLDINDFMWGGDEQRIRGGDLEDIEREDFELFLASPVSLTTHLMAQLAMRALSASMMLAAYAIIGNLENTGYLSMSLDEIAAQEGLPLTDMEQALKEIQGCTPPGIGARSLRECLLLQLRSRSSCDDAAWQIADKYLDLAGRVSESELAGVLGRSIDDVRSGLNLLRSLDPKPGARYSEAGAQQIQPDVYFVKQGQEWIVELHKDATSNLHLNRAYIRMLRRPQYLDKDATKYLLQRLNSARQLILDIDYRKRTILRVCESIVQHQVDFLEYGPAHLKPQLIT
jgi:RNA polymerase sigma-54 factor